MAKTIYLLGAKDPEMDFIEKLLKRHKLLFEHATADGRRVHPANAYKADGVSVLVAGDTLVCIECHPQTIPNGVKKKVIDHHNPGDPGFAKGPKEFWEASSVGQLYKFLRLRPDQKARVLAAMDHCFAPASRGACPGVTPEEVIALKVKEIAVVTKAPVSVVAKRVVYFANLLNDAELVNIGGEWVRDLRKHYLGEGWSLDVLAAQVAIAKSGKIALLRHRHRDGHPEKVALSGHAKASLVEAFMLKWAPAEKLANIYGSPERGYAGGYIIK